MKKLTFNRNLYKKVKKMDRQEMENFFKFIEESGKRIGYEQGFRDGADAGDKADFKIKLIQVLNNTKGVGDKTIRKVLNTLKEMEKSERF